MTEIDAGFHETCKFSFRDESLKGVDYLDALWSDSPSLNFLQSSNSNSSTKSSCSIPDSLYHSDINSSPLWRIDEEEEVNNIREEEGKKVPLVPGKDRELEEALAYFWPGMNDEEEQNDHHALKPLTVSTESVSVTSPLLPSFSSVSLEVEFNKGEEVEEVDNTRLEHQLSSADTAWTAAVEFPGENRCLLLSSA